MSFDKKHTTYHLLLGVLIGLWIIIFLVLIAPFDVAEVSFSNRLKMMPTYGLLFALAYFIVHFGLEKLLNRTSLNFWSIELTLLLGILMISIGPVFMYYRSNYIQGDYALNQFALKVYLPIYGLVLPLLLVGRWLISHRLKSSNKIIEVGKGKYDKLLIALEDLIFIKSADNYIEINYLVNQNLHQKLIRLTLKEAKAEIDGLIQTHRSYLINPQHFLYQKDKKTLVLKHAEVPLSVNFQNTISEIDQFRHK